MEWPRVELGKIAEIRGGATPRRNNPAYWGGDIPWLTPTDLPANGTGITDVVATENYITEEGLASCSASLLPTGTVLFSSRASIGKLGIAGVPLATNQGFANFIPRPGVDSRYLAWCLHFDADRIAGLAGSTTFKEVSKSALRTFRIPLPPLSEQRRIVEILDQADRLRRLRAEADAKADRILPALLARAVGNPRTWAGSPQYKPLKALVEAVSGATPSKNAERFWDGEVPWVSPKDMKRDFLCDSQDHVSVAALSDTTLSLINKEAVLIVVRGMILARDIPIAINLRPVTINQDMKALIPKKNDVTGPYVWAALYLAKPVLTSLVRTAGHGTRKLDTPDLMQFEIPVPDPHTLKKVTSIVEHRRLSIERCQVSKNLLDRLFAVVLAKAFHATLTRSWREAHMKELLQEMERQVNALATG